MKVKILVVDDEPDLQKLMMRKFKHKIENKEYDLLFATNGQEALLMLEKDPSIGVILTDINMPVMDGLTFLDRMSELGRVYKAVVVSAYGDMSNIRIAMNRGASDFITKPVDFSDLQHTIDKMIEEYIKQFYYHDMKKELDIARLIQLDMLPKDFSLYKDKNVEISGQMISAKDVGGDCFDFFYLNDDRLCVFISDVSGKGIPACLFMTVTKVLFRMLAESGMDCGQIMTELNSLLSSYSSYMFVTGFTAILDFEKNTLTYSSAAHCPSYILHPDGTVEQLKCPCSVPLGVGEKGTENADYTLNEISIKEGDCLYLYTDGVIEAMNHSYELYGTRRLEETLKPLCSSPVKDINEKVISSVKSFTLNERQHDDITMLAIRYSRTIS